MRRPPPAAAPATAAAKASAAAGFTLIELMIALAVLAVLGAMAGPSLWSQVSRQRLQSAAHELQADVSLAKLSSARQGLPVHLRFHSGSDWCYLLTTGPGGECQHAVVDPARGVIKVSRAADHPGIALSEALDITVDAAQPGLLPEATRPGQAVFSTGDGLQLRVRVGVQLRASLCSAGPPIPGTPACAAEAPLAPG